MPKTDLHLLPAALGHHGQTCVKDLMATVLIGANSLCSLYFELEFLSSPSVISLWLKFAPERVSELTLKDVCLG